MHDHQILKEIVDKALVQNWRNVSQEAVQNRLSRENRALIETEVVRRWQQGGMHGRHSPERRLMLLWQVKSCSGGIHVPRRLMLEGISVERLLQGQLVVLHRKNCK